MGLFVLFNTFARKYETRLHWGILFLKDLFWPFPPFLHYFHFLTLRLSKIIAQITSDFSQQKKYLFSSHMNYLWYINYFDPLVFFLLNLTRKKKLTTPKWHVARHAQGEMQKKFSRRLLIFLSNMQRWKNDTLVDKKNTAGVCWNMSDCPRQYFSIWVPVLEYSYFGVLLSTL